MSFLQGTIYLAISLLVVSGASAEPTKTGNIVEIEINGVQFSITGEFVRSRKPRTKGSPEHLWVAFSIPSHEPLGEVKGPDGQPRIDSEKRKELRARGEDIIELRLVPERGRLRRLEKSQLERICRQVELTELRGVAGYACSFNSTVMMRVFPISALAGQAALVCKHYTNVREGKEGETCEVVVEGRQDGVSLVLEYVDPDSILKFPLLVSEAESFVAQKMKRPR